MGKYDGFLICSDYDNTLTYRGVLPKENIEAIKEFHKNGGKFILATGRTIDSVLSFDNELLKDGYIITNNGNVLYDVYNKKLLKTITMPNSCMEILRYNKDKWSKYITEFGVYYPEKSIYNAIDADVCIDNLEKITKMTFNCDSKEDTLMIMQDNKERFGDDYHFCRAWPFCFEVCSKLGGKGNMVLELAKILSNKKLICVGDFENDLDMLKVADISFAPDNAISSVKDITEKIIVNSESGIFKAIIDMI